MTEGEMYEAVIHNDASCDKRFFYGVLSTGIFCRPSCPSKKPLRKNVRFFQSAEEAAKAGFRPCKRCWSDLSAYRPMEDAAEAIRRHLEEWYARQVLWSEELQKIGLSRRRAVAVFKEAYGMTPRAYVDLLRLSEAKRLLVQTDAKIIDIAASVGFEGLSTFNRFFKEKTGLSPSAYRKGHR